MSFQDETKSILADELEKLRRTIIEHHFVAGQKASGRTAASMRVEVGDNEGVLFGRKAFDVLETGRKAGKTPSGFHAIILQWMRDKGVKGTPIAYKTDRSHKYSEQERGDRTLAYFISRKIRNEGTRLFRDGGRADIYSNAIPETKRRILERIAAVVRVEIQNIKLNNTEVG